MTSGSSLLLSSSSEWTGCGKESNAMFSAALFFFFDVKFSRRAVFFFFFSGS